MPVGVIGKPPAPIAAKPAEPTPKVPPPAAPVANPPTAASASTAGPPPPMLADTPSIAAEPARAAAPQVDSAPSKPVTTPAVPSGQPALRFSFRDEAWVEVRDGTGRIVFSQLNATGDEELVTGKPPFSLVVGNAAHVDLTYNDKPVDLLPHVRVRVARLTLK